MVAYTREFFKGFQRGSRRSAKEVIPLILDLLHPKSVVDVGCGVGCWLSVFNEFGIDDFLGIDGDYVDRKMLEIPEARFLARDLKTPFHLEREFDLVVSLEVAEHLPPERAESFVDSLTRLGPFVLFSAAVPFQGGTRHLNEQWPEYWAEYFNQKAYVTIDCLRKRVWKNDNVECWYAQNMLLFAREASLDGYPRLQQELEDTHPAQLSLVHPRIYLSRADLRELSVKRSMAALPISLVHALKRWRKRIRARNG